MKRWRWAVIAVTAVLLAVGAAAFLAWHFSSAALVPDHSAWPATAVVERVSHGTVDLERNSETERPGVYGLDWQGGHAIIGEVIHRQKDRVARRLRGVQGLLEPAMKVAVDPNVYVGNPRQALGLPFRTVGVPDELGPMPAWIVPGRSATWAIVVHGINGDRQEGLRIAPALHRAGLPTMLISYRGDLGAPPGPDGLHHMGLTEWRDLQAAVRYALGHGARRVLLAGYSMGGSLIAQFMERSALAPRVAGLLLDAPALDWRSILEFQAGRMGLPGLMALPVEWAIDLRVEPDWGSLDALEHPQAFHLPILLFHGIDDGTVPISTSDRFRTELGGSVTYFRVPDAGHTEAWNVNPSLYDRRLRAFLGSIRGRGAT